MVRLAGLPALLRRIPDAETLLNPEQPGQKEGSFEPAALVLRAAKLRRHRALAAAGAALIIGVAVAVSALDHGEVRSRVAEPPASEATVQAVNPATGASARVRYAPRPWGTAIEARISGVLPGTRCQLWVTGADGIRFPAGGWVIASRRGGFWYPGSSPLPAAALRSFEITSQGRTLITMPARAVLRDPARGR